MEDQISATKMALKAFEELYKADPEHELVKFFTSDEVSDEAFTNRFWKREKPWEGLPGSMVTMVVETNYYLEVKEVLKEKYAVEI